ncbi:hypothetical protein DVS77_09490 [Mycolicibacterium moriokaense]|nr:hypothetical protein DVS77_09490 [Mycolicibacterium moriokaense]
MVTLLLCWIRLGASRPQRGCSERARRGAQLRSAATTTTARSRDAAQIDCAALGEHHQEAGGHAGQLTQ